MSLRSPSPIVWDDRLKESDKKLVTDLNASLDRLDGLRAVEINPTGPFVRSKIAWKLVTYQHALLHRIVALMDGVGVAFNARSTLTVILAARAFMETLAVMSLFEERVRALLKAEDLGGLNALVQNSIFASPDPDFTEEFPDAKAVNILTYIDKFDKRAPGFRGHFDLLSERCHPNSAGHNFMFSKLDRLDGSVTYFEESHPERNAQMILAAVAALPLTGNLMARLDDLILKVSELHHRVSPMRGDQPESGG